MKIDLTRRKNNSAKYSNKRIFCPDRYDDEVISHCENNNAPEDEDNCIIICDCYQCPRKVTPESA